MLRHKSLNLAVPQSEHLRLAGTLSQLWGNKDFDKPNIDINSFTEGVALHDLGYGLVDNYVIFEMSPQERRKSLENLINQKLSNPVSTLISSYHVNRLLEGTDFEDLKLRNKEKINKLLKETKLEAEELEWIDRITDFCDSVSFDFCLGSAAENQVGVFQKIDSQDLTTLTYTINEDNLINIHPWPLKVEEYEGYILGYDPKNYPTTLSPKIITYKLQKS